MDVDFAALRDAPALWGGLGAFIYAAPRWVACLVACREAKARAWPCSLEFGVALASGGIASAAFSALVMQTLGIKDASAIAAMVGLLANPTAPVLVSRVSAAVANTLAGKVEKTLPGDKP